MQSLKERILRYIQLHSDRNVTAREIELRAMAVGHNGSTAKRRAQELVVEGLIESVGTSKCAAWRAK